MLWLKHKNIKLAWKLPYYCNAEKQQQKLKWEEEKKTDIETKIKTNKETRQQHNSNAKQKHRRTKGVSDEVLYCNGLKNSRTHFKNCLTLDNLHGDNAIKLKNEFAT